MTTLTKKISEQQARDKVWSKFRLNVNKGHGTYTHRAKYLEWMYLDGDHQKALNPDIQAKLDAEGKPFLGINLINASIRTILGYQSQSRMNIAYQPRELGDQNTAEILTKIALYELDRNGFPWIESQVFEDGIIQQRGYFDIRMDYTKSLAGEISITAEDPLDVIPDGDAKSYDPEEWNDVTVTRWLTTDQLKEQYPKQAKDVYKHAVASEHDWGNGDEMAQRNSFSMPIDGSPYFRGADGDNIYVRVLDTQYRRIVRRDYFYDPEADHMEPVPDKMTKAQSRRLAKSSGREIITKTERRIRWHVSTQDVTLHDDWSPYEHFTIVPYFPIFRRGKTIGLVDSLVDNQLMMEKVYSQMLHIVNTTANSGWMWEAGSLNNMDAEDMEVDGSKTGLNLEVKRGRPYPTKIQPNPMPQGLAQLFDTARGLHDQILGVTAAFRGERTNEVSGQAIQNRISQTAVGLTTVIDNLFRSRNMVAKIILNLIQNFYTEERTFKIISDKNTGEANDVTINEVVEEPAEAEEMASEVNEEMDQDAETVYRIINDTTVGKYDTVISDVPTEITYADAQLSQAMELRKFGIAIPDHEVVRLTTLTRKEEIAKELSGEVDEEAQEQIAQTQLEEAQAKINKLEGDAIQAKSDAMKSAAEIAQMIAENPAVGPILGRVLASQEIAATEVPPQAPEPVETLPEAPVAAPGAGLGGNLV